MVPLSSAEGHGSLWRVLEGVFSKRDHEFESAFLQQPVCLSGEPRVPRRNAPHFGGILRTAGDVRRDMQAANRDSFALSL
jgi:hypothetical protein